MKKVYRILFASLLAVLALAACQRKEQEPIEWRTELQVVNSELVFAPFGGSDSFTVNLSGASVTSNKSWCQASVSGTNVDVTVGAWGGLESRYAVLTLTREGESVDVTVIQQGVNLGGVEIGSEIILSGEAGEYTYPFESNANMGVSTEDSWITPSLEEDGVLKLTVAPNPDKATRIGTLVVTVGDVVSEVSVIQYPVFENTPDWVVTYSGNKVSSGTEYSTLTNTVSADHGLYTLAVVTPAQISSSGLSEADFVRDVMVPALAEEINAAVDLYRAYGYDVDFSSFLLEGTDWDYVSLLEDGTYVGLAIGFDANGYPTGWYTADTVEIGKLTPYQMWLGEWSVPRGDGADTWIVTENVENESFKVWGIAGFDADDYATGAFVAIVGFDSATNEMVFKVYENKDVTWQDSSRGTMNALLSGQYTNVEGKTYYSSGVGNVICRAKMAADGLTADLTPRSVTSAGQPAFFYNIRWYGRYTNSSGSRSGVSWNGYETALPNKMTKK